MRSRGGSKARTCNMVKRKDSVTETSAESQGTSLAVSFVKGRKGGILDCFRGADLEGKVIYSVTIIAVRELLLLARKYF